MCFCDVAHTLPLVTLMNNFSILLRKRHSMITILALAVPIAAMAQEVVEVHVSPAAISLAVGQRERLYFSAFDADGNIADRPVYRLSTSNSLVARVEANGTVLAVAAGEAMLVVRAGQGSTSVRVVVHGGTTGRSGHTGDSTEAYLQADPDMASTVHRVVVTPAPSPDAIAFPLGDSRSFRVQPLAEDSLPAPVAVVWSLTDSSVARFDRATGLLLGTGVGTTDLIAGVPGVVPIRWRIVVNRLELVLTDGPVTLAVDEERQVHAEWHTVGGDMFAKVQQSRWYSTEPEVATVDSAGRIRGVDFGHAEVMVVSQNGDTARAGVYVVGDLLLSLGGRVEDGAGIYQTRLGHGSLSAVLEDGSTNVYPSRSPGRESIVFASDRERGLYDLFRMNPHGGDLRQLTDSPGHHTQPAWAPDGSILFTSTRSGIPQVFELSADGEVRILTTGEEQSHSPAVSPDGRTIALVQGRGPAARVFLMDRDGQHLRPARLGEQGRWERGPRFFPNGDLAAVVQIGERATAIFRWDQDRDVRLPLLTSDSRIREFSISGDGRFLAAVIESTARQGQRTKLLIVDLTTSESEPLSVPLAPSESITHVSF